MSKIEKLIKKIFLAGSISYDDAERILLSLGFDLQISSSHHNFRKKGYPKTVTIKKRKQLLPYQIRLLQEVLKDHNEE